jgi:hypothetical protein
VKEYYLYDPTREYLQPSLRAFVLRGSGYMPMSSAVAAVEVGELLLTPGSGEAPEYISEVLGLRITLDEANQIRIYDLASGERLLSDAEARQEAEARAQSALFWVEQEALRAEQAEAENARLRAELAKLRGEEL